MNFHPPFSEPPSFFFFSYPSNIEIIFDFSDIITKIHPPFQNPGSALGTVTDQNRICIHGSYLAKMLMTVMTINRRNKTTRKKRQSSLLDLSPLLREGVRRLM